MTSLITRAQDGFAAAFGYPPDGIWSAPGRVNLIGEHTDYNEGFVLPFGIDRRTIAALALRDDGLVRVSSSAESASGTEPSEALPTGEVTLSAAVPGDVRGWAAYPLGVAWGLGKVGADLAGLRGFDVHFASDVPVGAGLSSSAALECALAVAVAEDCGALGARMTGGGFGGSAIALLPAALVPEAQRATLHAFNSRGYGTPETFTVHPSQGARRNQ